MPDQVENFVKKWAQSRGGAERANYALFLVELCDLLGVPHPDPATSETEYNDYVFERAVRFKHEDGSTSPGRIDLYKRGCFVLEAKQSKKREKGGEVYEQLALALTERRAAIAEAKQTTKKSREPLSSTWDALMRSARKQAENYARALDEWPPFLVIVDVGNVIELYADFSRQGKNYAQFPDRNSFRIDLKELRNTDARERLKRVWLDPLSLDPSRHAAEVTQDIAALLARMTVTMERRAPSQEPELKAEWAYKVSKFLMRCVFAMFAEDIGLLPKGAFLGLIDQHKRKADRFHHAAADFFKTMDKGGYSLAIQKDIRKFNGGLFHEAITVEVTEDELALLRIAAGRRWREVEPAIFGTLLEQALSERERSKLGAHYTPRAYVERLVVPTIIEPLREDWENVQSAAIGKLVDRDEKAAREIVKKFHDLLCDTRVLDPACGTGNFLYVAMELMKRLEGEVLDFLKGLGETVEPLRTVDPHQFLGLELNPRAVPTAELVLWIGYIQWWFRTRERQVIAEPILKDFGTIAEADAVLEYDKQELLRDAKGRPITRQDPHALRLHPITGEYVPDPDARLPVYQYINPRPARWPEAEFIVGNPPFIGGKDLREELGEGYTKALWASRGKRSDSIDYVMYWWNHAASLLTRRGTRLRRFGFITTNKITQKFSRRIVEKHLKADKPISLVFAVPDHPWSKAPKKAAVRIAMTVAQAQERTGRLAEVLEEKNLETDQPSVSVIERSGRINPDLSIGTDVTSLVALQAMERLSGRGVQLMGDGFIASPAEAAALGLGRVPGLKEIIKPYLHNRDLKDRPRGVLVIDLFGLSEGEVRQRYPEIWQRLHETVRADRQAQFDKSPTNDAAAYLENWWLFGKPREELRDASRGLERVIVTGETSKHRFFEFIPAGTVVDNMVRVIASSDAYHLGVLSSHVHTVFSLRKGGWMGVGNDPRYQAECFTTFPFPAGSVSQEQEIRGLADELDALRKRVIAAHDFLTMTALYNVREKLVLAAPLDESDVAIQDTGCVSVIHDLHKKIDKLVLQAYGWPAQLTDEEMVARLVALNKVRLDEESRGLVRWLRPDYQAPRATVSASKPQQFEALLPAPEIAAPMLPKDDAALLAVLRLALHRVGRPIEAKALSHHFGDGGKGTRRIERGLNLLGAAGVARLSKDGWFIPTDRPA